MTPPSAATISQLDATPTRPFVTPTVGQALLVIAVGRLAYGIDAALHGSLQMRLAAGVGYSQVYAVVTVAVALLVLGGMKRTRQSGRVGTEMVAQYAAAALGCTLFIAAVWNGFHAMPHGGWVGGWPHLILGTLAFLRARALSAFYGKQPL